MTTVNCWIDKYYKNNSVGNIDKIWNEINYFIWINNIWFQARVLLRFTAGILR